HLLQGECFPASTSGSIFFFLPPGFKRAPHWFPAGASELRLSEGKFQAFLDLLEVSARHPQRLDRHGFVSREFCRTYVLPADVDPWRVRAALSHDGILNLEAPREAESGPARVIDVQQSPQPNVTAFPSQ
uniref:Cilia and flagella associated protein 68 n=1 Tax=Sus scrofa TaxID=9823 RepID=A0A8D1GVV1_PIG